jgi:hypothetical protein
MGRAVGHRRREASAGRQITWRTSRRINVTMAETSTEPTQPRLLEKKTNTGSRTTP